MSERTQEPFGASPERQGPGAAQEPPANAAPGEGRAAERPAEKGPEEEAFSAEGLLRELEAAPGEDARARKKQNGPRTDDGRPNDEAGAGLDLQGLLEELDASEQAGRGKTRDAARNGKKPLRRRAAVFFALLLAAVAVVFQFIGFAVIDGASMTPSLSEHDFLVYWKLPDEIGRGEVLLCRSEGYNGQILAKRVIGLPGDVVEVDEDGRVLLNGEPYAETTAVYGASEWGSDVRFPIRVQEDCYFVLGDNRAVSVDSRQSVIGQIDRQDVIGRVICWFHME